MYKEVYCKKSYKLEKFITLIHLNDNGKIGSYEYYEQEHIKLVNRKDRLDKLERILYYGNRV